MSFNLIFKMENSKHIYKKPKSEKRANSMCVKVKDLCRQGFGNLWSQNPSVTCQRTKETSNDFYCEVKEKEEGHESFCDETRAILASTFANFNSYPQ